MFFRLEADRMVNAVLRGWEAQRFTVLEQFFVLQRNETGRFQEALNGVTGLAHPDLHPHRRPPARPRVLEPRQHAPHVRRLHRAEQCDADARRRLHRGRGASARDELFRARARHAPVARQHGRRVRAAAGRQRAARLARADRSDVGHPLSHSWRRSPGSADLRRHRPGPARRRWPARSMGAGGCPRTGLAGERLELGVAEHVLADGPRGTRRGSRRARAHRARGDRTLPPRDR